MFYDANKVDNALLCRFCAGRLDIPKILPCGETICSFCVSSIRVNDTKFECPVCKERHEMPKNGLSINKSLSEVLSVKQTEIPRSKSFVSFEKSLNEIKKKRNFIKISIDNKNDLITEHFMNLRNEVQLTTEEAHEQIDNLNAKIIEEIDEYEMILTHINETNSEKLNGFNIIVKELESFHNLKIKFLKQPLVMMNDEKLINSNKEAIKLNDKAELEINKLKDMVLDGKLFTFKKNKEKVEKSFLGSIEVESFNGMLKSYQMKNLLLLCKFPADQMWHLIYRASQDGFKSADFHSKCDDKFNTLIIVKSTNDNIFGGITEESWSSHDLLFEDDPKSFIFSFVNQQNKPLKIKWSQNFGICRNNGISFGGGHDLFIANKSNTNTLSYSNLGNSYTHPDYKYGSNEAKSYLAGSFHFHVSEIEVYSTQTWNGRYH